MRCAEHWEAIVTNLQRSITSGELSRSEWVAIHNHAARDYKVSEWSREVLLGASAHRKRLFSRVNGNVLDVACGYGLNFAYLPNATRISGVDFSPVMLDMAREHVRALGLPVNLSEGDAEALDFPDSSFDTVISALSTCSFQHPIVALQEMRRVCKPEGRILLIEHGRSSWAWIGWFQDRRAQAWSSKPAVVGIKNRRHLCAQRVSVSSRLNAPFAGSFTRSKRRRQKPARCLTTVHPQVEVGYTRRDMPGTYAFGESHKQQRTNLLFIQTT